MPNCLRFNRNRFWINFFLLIVFFLWQCRVSQGQTAKGLSIQPGTSVSYSGTNIYLPFALNYGRHELYIAPKRSLSTMEWGINGGYNFAVVKSHRWGSFVNLDYHYLSQHNKTVQNNIPDAEIGLQEVFLGLGLRYFFGQEQKLALGFHVGEGVYIERYYNSYDDRIVHDAGRSHIVKLQLCYKFLQL